MTKLKASFSFFDKISELFSSKYNMYSGTFRKKGQFDRMELAFLIAVHCPGADFLTENSPWPPVLCICGHQWPPVRGQAKLLWLLVLRLCGHHGHLVHHKKTGVQNVRLCFAAIPSGQRWTCINAYIFITLDPSKE